MQSSADVLTADQATTERVKVLVPFGLTERQDRFLAIVMLHSGDVQTSNCEATITVASAALGHLQSMLLSSHASSA